MSVAIIKRFRRWLRRERYTAWAMNNWESFRLGYITALDDIERTGLQPATDKTKRESADRALKKLVDIS